MTSSLVDDIVFNTEFGWQIGQVLRFFFFLLLGF